MKEFILKNSVHLGVGHMCRHGMKLGNDLVYKPTRWMSSGRLIVEALALRCSGDHSHGRLFGGSRSRQAQVYPALLCKHIMQGFVKQMEAEAGHRDGDKDIGSLTHNQHDHPTSLLTGANPDQTPSSTHSLCSQVPGRLCIIRLGQPKFPHPSATDARRRPFQLSDDNDPM